jgi:hypothetical protein
MRTLLLVLMGAITLAGAASAQPCRDHQLESCLRNQLGYGVTIDMNSDDVHAVAGRRKWTLLESSRDTLRYRAESGSGPYTWPPWDAIYTVTFVNGKARGVAERLTAAAGKGKRATQIFDDMSRRMRSWCGTVPIDPATAFRTHAASDGRTVRMSLKRIGSAEVVIEVAVEESAAGPGVLK